MKGTSLRVSGGVYRNAGTEAGKRKDNAETRKALGYVADRNPRRELGQAEGGRYKGRSNPAERGRWYSALNYGKAAAGLPHSKSRVKPGSTT